MATPYDIALKRTSTDRLADMTTPLNARIAVTICQIAEIPPVSSARRPQLPHNTLICYTSRYARS